jgi:hypothetical protein
LSSLPGEEADVDASHPAGTWWSPFHYNHPARVMTMRLSSPAPATAGSGQASASRPHGYSAFTFQLFRPMISANVLCIVGAAAVCEVTTKNSKFRAGPDVIHSLVRPSSS